MLQLEIIDTPDYSVAHPEEGTNTTEPCAKCAIAVRPDTGDLVLLWLCGGINWSLSREAPNFERHRDEITVLEIRLPQC